MNLEEVLLELYRLAETKTWDGEISDEALSAAIEGMERIWELHQADLRKDGMINPLRGRSPVWC